MVIIRPVAIALRAAASESPRGAAQLRLDTPSLPEIPFIQ